MGSLFTTGQVTQSSTGGGVASGTVLPAGTEITGITSGAVFLDFVAGTITLPEGSPTPLVRPMQKNLNDVGLTQCNSIGIWVSDADAICQIGSAVTLADHQLSRVVNNYGFSNVTITIPANSTPDDTNQIFLWQVRITGSVTLFQKFLIREVKLTQPQSMQLRQFCQNT